MLNTFKLYSNLSESMEPASAKAITEAIGELYEELKNSVTKTEFGELREIVRDLAEAQKRTEIRVEELAEAQKRTEIRVEELAEAQKRTEKRVEELAEAQKRTEKRVEELAEAQKRTEAELHELVKDHKVTRTMLGGVSDAVGYGLEDMAILGLPSYLEKKHGIRVAGELERRFVEYPDGRHDELNIIGEGVRAGETITICGEAKTRLAKKHVTDFLKVIERLERQKMIKGKPFLFMVFYSVVPEVERYAIEHDLTVIPSYKVRHGGY